MTCSDKKFQEFLGYISKLEPIEFLGIAKILSVPVLEKEEDKARDFSDILLDVMNKFEGLNRKKRREILKIISAAVRRGES